jgi:hypothetical protein
MDLQSILKKAAPWLAAAAAGPAGLAGMAIKTVAEALGADASATGEQLAAAVAGATPEQIKALRLAEIDFRVRMQELGFKQVTDLEGIAAADRADARAMQVSIRSPMPAVLTISMAVGFLATLGALFFLPIPEANRDLIVYMCGQLAAAFAACLAFWVGTTRSSENKTGLLAQAKPIGS